MIRMLQLSLLLGRIVQRGRIVASQAAFVSPARTTQRHQFAELNHRHEARYHVAVAASSNTNEDDDDVEGGVEDMNPRLRSRKGRKTPQSRLSSIYDEMFADKDDSDESDQNEQQTQKQKQQTQEQEFLSRSSEFLSRSTLEKEMDFELDNDFPDFPQGLPLETSSTPKQPPRSSRAPAQIRENSSAVPQQSSTPSVQEVKFVQKGAKPPKAPSAVPQQSSTPSAEKVKFAQKGAKPPKARMLMGRPMPPSVMEYDNSHYDEEFGAAQYGESEIPEFHDGMLEEMTQAETGTSSNTNVVQPSYTDVDDDKENVNVNTDVSPPPPKLDIRPSDTNTIEDSNESSASNPTQLEQEVESKLKTPWVPQTKPPPRPAGRSSVSSEALSILRSSANGNGGTDQADILQHQLLQIQTEIYKLNNGEEFNINSPKQVSKCLFGVENESTNKAALEALNGNITNSGGNAQLASLILKFRKYTRDLKMAEKQKENQANGIHVNTVSSMRGGKDQVQVEAVKPSSIVSPLGSPTGDGDDNGDGVREPLVLIDASAYIFRAYYSMPPIHRHDGEPTGATLGFCNMLNKLVLTPMLRGEQPRVVLVFDSKEGTNFRKILYPEYKSNRKACPEDLIPQFEFVRDAASAYGILQLEAPGYEADDVIATLSNMAVDEGCHVNILSGDKDLMQLVTKDDGGACIEMIDPMKMIRFCHTTVTEKWGVEPHLVGDVLGLAGDSADNIPGVPGIGPKIAASLIQDFGSLEALLENVDDVKQKGRREKLIEHTDLARLSRQLVELERNVPMEDMSFPAHFASVSDFRMEKLDQERLLKFYESMGFQDLTKRVTSRLPNGGIRGTSASSPVTAASPSVTDRYSSITDNVPTNKPEQSRADYRGGNGFSSPRFKAPPKPEDYSDVPF